MKQSFSVSFYRLKLLKRGNKALSANKLWFYKTHRSLVANWTIVYSHIDLYYRLLWAFSIVAPTLWRQETALLVNCVNSLYTIVHEAILVCWWTEASSVHNTTQLHLTTYLFSSAWVSDIGIQIVYALAVACTRWISSERRASDVPSQTNTHSTTREKVSDGAS